jgi:hypothetical protein
MVYIMRVLVVWAGMGVGMMLLLLILGMAVKP